MLSLGGSMDHAVIDGAALARFTIALEQRLADAEGMAGLIEAAEAR